MRVAPGFGDLPEGVTWLEHTADAGFHVSAPSPGRVYEQAVAALRSLLLGNAVVEPRCRIPLRLEGEDRAERLVALLEEVIFRLEVERFVTAGAEVQEDSVGPGSLSLHLIGEPWDPARHRVLCEVKAVTYHRLSFMEEAGGARATVVVDL